MGRDVNLLPSEAVMLRIDKAGHIVIIEAAKQQLESFCSSFREILTGGCSEFLLFAVQDVDHFQVIRGRTLTLLGTGVGETTEVFTLFLDDVTSTDFIGEDAAVLLE